MQISHESEIRQLLNISLPSKTPINFLDSALALLEKHEFLETNFELALLLERCFGVCIDSKQQAKYNPLLWKICQIYMNDCFGDSAGFWALLHRAVYKKRKVLKLADDQLQELLSFFEVLKEKATEISDCETLYNILSDIKKERVQKQALAKWMIDCYWHSAKKCEPLIRQHFLQKAFELAHNKELPNEINRLGIELREAGLKTLSSMAEFTVETEIKKDELENYLTDFIQPTFEHSIVHWIGQGFIDYEAQLQEFKKNQHSYKASSLFSTSLQDHEGRVVATIPGSFEDSKPHFKRHIAQFYQINSSFRILSMQKILETFQPKTDDFMAFMEQSVCFNPNKKELLRDIFNSFLEKRYSVCLHLAVPYFESCIRVLGEKLGISIYTEDKLNKGTDLKPLGRLLQDYSQKDSIVKVFSADLIEQCKLLFTDELGLNLRNRLCHGMMNDDDFSLQNALIVIDSILTLGLWRLEKAVE